MMPVTQLNNVMSPFGIGNSAQLILYNLYVKYQLTLIQEQANML